MSLLRCDQLTFGYDKPLLTNLTLAVASGQTWLIEGPSGVGKSTLLRLLANLKVADNLQVSGKIWRAPARYGFVFQDDQQLYPWKTACQNVALALRASGTVNRRSAAQLAKVGLTEVGLADALDKYPHQLSGGMKQRVAMARAIVNQPAILFLDEPFAGIDADQVYSLIDLLLALQRRHGFAIVLVTHNRQFAAPFKGQHLTIDGGAYSIRR